MDSISRIIEPLKAQNRVVGSVAARQDAAMIEEYVHKLERALSDYQVCGHKIGE